MSEGSGGAGELASDPAHRVVDRLSTSGLTLACAESLTGGLIGASLTAVPGSSAVFRGGVIAYATDLKVTLLGVPVALLEQHGPVHREVALAMAHGAVETCGADLAIAVTGVAGPEPQGGQPVGRVHAAVVWPGRDLHRHTQLDLPGDRATVRAAVGDAALRLVLECVDAAEQASS